MTDLLPEAIPGLVNRFNSGSCRRVATPAPKEVTIVVSTTAAAATSAPPTATSEAASTSEHRVMEQSTDMKLSVCFNEREGGKGGEISSYDHGYLIGG